MSYTPTTDFLALLRSTGNGVRTEAMPGLDYVVSAMARAGLFTLYVGQTAPTVNQTTTVWFQPAFPNSWAREGTLYLWDAASLQYVAATPSLWSALLSPAAVVVFQVISIVADTVAFNTTLCAIERTGPTTTTVLLPSVSARGGKVLRVVDWSNSIANHQIILTPNGAETIMKQPTFSMFSTPDQLAGILLYPSPDLNAWVIAP